MLRKRAQAWGFDLIIATMIFIAGMVIFYLYSLNFADQSEEIINSLNYDGEIIGDMLLSEGFPKNWTESNVVTIGIMSNNKVNETKLERFYNLAISDYPKTRGLFNTRYEYYIILPENISVGGVQVHGIGNEPSGQANLVKINRIVIYNDKPTTFKIEVWQ